MNNINIQKLKLFVLQKKYSEICNSIKVLQEHINFLYKNNFIEYSERTTVFSKLQEISKNINTHYNEYINVEIENEDSSDNSEISDLKNDNNIFSSLIDLDECFKNEDASILEIENKPLLEYQTKINQRHIIYGFKFIRQN